VCIDGWIRALVPGETLEEARDTCSSPELLSFFDAWNEVKEAALGLIPEDPIHWKRKSSRLH